MLNSHSLSRQQGFTLIELMIALLIGLIVVAAAAGMFLSNSRVYGATESVGRIQENARASFELMSRDIREAGGTACSGLGSLLGNNPATSTLSQGVGVSGDRLQLYLANADTTNVVSHVEPGGNLKVASANNFAVGDVLLACNADTAIVIDVASKLGNDLKPSADLANSAGSPYCLLRPTGGTWSASCSSRGNSAAFVARLARHQWWVEDNNRGGRSLYRNVAYPNATGAFGAGTTSEVAEGVSAMQLAFRRDTDSAFQTSYSGWSASDWKRVVAVQVRLTVRAEEGAQRGADVAGTDGNALTREVVTTTALRNREGVL